MKFLRFSQIFAFVSSFIIYTFKMNLKGRIIIEAQEGNFEMSDSESVADEDNNDHEYIRNKVADPQALKLLESVPGRPCIYDSLRVITLEELVTDNVEVGRSLLTVQVLSIKVAASSNAAKEATGQYNYRLRNKNENVDGQYKRIFLLGGLKSRTNECCYIIESGGKNKNLWTRNPMHRDDGTLTVGSIIALPMPKKITSLMANEIMIVETTLSAYSIKKPQEFPEKPINFQVSPKVSAKLFIIVNVIYILLTTFSFIFIFY